MNPSESICVQSEYGMAIQAELQPGLAEAVCLQASASDVVLFGFTPSFPFSSTDYIFMPACAYNGNRFDVLHKDYPPLFTPEEAGKEIPVTITDIPRLEKDGSGRLEVTTADLSVPCVGVFSRVYRRAWLLFTVQKLNGLDLGLCYENGAVTVSYPKHRKQAYLHFHMTDSQDQPRLFRQGERISLPYRIVEEACEDMADFFALFARNRSCMGLNARRPAVMDTALQIQLQLHKFNTRSWFEPGKFYGVGTDPANPNEVWQPGWVGGAINSYAIMKLGGEPEWQRGVLTLQHLFRTQCPSGFFSEAATADGKPYHGIFGKPWAENWHLLRQSADVLYYLFKHFDLFRERNKPIPQEFLAGTKKLADAFVRLWSTEGQMGQFADLQTGELLVGGSTGCAIVGAGLVRAYEFFGGRRYLDTAAACSEQYYTRDLMQGYTTGGPEEILQCPDSESAFGLLESLVQLYRVTGDTLWLSRAKTAADYCSSWVTAYNFEFPANSEFGRLGMKTIGSVFANVQNKHAAPGICTLSGESLYHLYRWTGLERCRTLFLDIVTGISQYMSTEERPIHDWSSARRKLPPGFINERVNLSDWEGEACVGGVFYGSCWCETTNLLVLADCMEYIKQLTETDIK